MHLIDRILIATDFGTGAHDALEFIMQLAGRFRPSITVIHVIPESEGSRLLKRELRTDAVEKLNKIKLSLKKRGVQSVETIVRFGHPFERILEYSEELDVDIIALGSGKDGSLGITPERVLTHAHKPVLIVKQGVSPKIEQILCPVDFSPASKRALQDAVALSRRLRAYLVVLRIFPPLLSSFFGPGKAPGEEHERFIKDEQESEFFHFLREFDFTDIAWSKSVGRGDSDKEICDFAVRLGVDLILMGSRGRRGLARMVLGSTTEKVVQQLPCSVIVLKQEHANLSELANDMKDIKRHFRKGKLQLRQSLFEEALHNFEYCARRNSLFTPAWDGMSAAYKCLGNEREAKKAHEIAEYIRTLLDESVS